MTKAEADMILQSASGRVEIPMTNDYLFRAFLQENNKALKGLISSLLHLKPEEIFSATIENPIELGKSVTAKDFFLDVKVSLHDGTIINLEMQVVNEHNWPERSMSYLCRTFDNINKGKGYSEVKPVIQIGLLDFTLFPDRPEFYATYKLLNVKNYKIYSDKLRISVLDLTHTELATDKDKNWQLDRWAALFKSKTWEEIKMLAQDNEYIGDASATIYKLTREEEIRLQCEAREDYFRRQRSNKHLYEKVCQEKEALEKTVAEQGVALEEKDATIAEISTALVEKDAALEEKDAALEEKDAALAEKDAALEEKDAALAKKDVALEEKDALIAELKAKLAGHTITPKNK